MYLSQVFMCNDYVTEFMFIIPFFFFFFFVFVFVCGMDIYVGNWPVLFNLYGPRAECDDAQRIQFKLTFYKILQVTNLS